MSIIVYNITKIEKKKKKDEEKKNIILLFFSYCNKNKNANFFFKYETNKEGWKEEKKHRLILNFYVWQKKKTFFLLI